MLDGHHSQFLCRVIVVNLKAKRRVRKAEPILPCRLADGEEEHEETVGSEKNWRTFRKIKEKKVVISFRTRYVLLNYHAEHLLTFRVMVAPPVGVAAALAILRRIVLNMVTLFF